MISNSDGKIAVSSVSSTELGYVSGVTSAIQTQLGGKLSTTTKYAAGDAVGGNANNALKLNGYASDTANTANTVVRRDGNKYIRAQYYNAACPDENINSFASSPAFIDSNGWLRKTSKTNLLDYLFSSTSTYRKTGTGLTVNVAVWGKFVTLSCISPTNAGVAADGTLVSGLPAPAFQGDYYIMEDEDNNFLYLTASGSLKTGRARSSGTWTTFAVTYLKA